MDNFDDLLLIEEEKPVDAKRRKLTFKPAHIIVLGFLGIILFGSFLLCLPISSISRQWTPYINSIFTATSAVCVTGLIVVDTASHFSRFGQVIILILIQAGGLGFMTLTTMFMLLLGKKITLKDRLVMQEALNQNANKGVVKLTRNIIFLTLAIESVGIIMLLPAFVISNGPIGIWQAVFTGISAFCNAGFDLFGTASAPYVSLTGYAGNVLVNLGVCMMIILGGMGFTVIMDVFKNKFNFRRFSLHSKVALIVTAILIVGGWLFIFLEEYSNVNTIANFSLGDKILAAFFQSVTARTAGFNTIDQNGMSQASKFITMLLMFIGASPASTGGGIKTTTVAILILMVIAGIKNDDEVIMNKHSISKQTAFKAVSLVLIGLALVFFVTLILLVTESGHVPADMLTLDNILFETFSAFGTVGLTTGVTPYLSIMGKILIMLVMFFGRVGPITIGLMFIGKRTNIMHYPNGSLMIG